MKILFALLASCLPSVFITRVILAQWIDAYVPDFKVNDDNLNSYQTNSSIGVDSAGNFVIIWYDARGNPGNQTPGRIYCQRFDVNGVPLGINFTIGHDTSGGKVAVLKDGRFIVTWVRYFRTGSSANYEYYFQRFDNSGLSLSPAARIIDSVFAQSDGSNGGLSVDCNINGRFVISFAVSKYFDSSRVYFQRYDSSGSRLGTVQRVNDVFSNVEIPDISMNNDGSFVVVWQDDRNANSRFDIYLQRFDPYGSKQGNNLKVNDDIDSSTNQYLYGISTDKSGYTVITWLDYRFQPVAGVFYQLYDQYGNANGPNRRADFSNLEYSIGEGKVSMREDRKFFISWVDLNYAGKEQIYGRRFDSSGEPIGNPFMIPSSSPGTSVQIESDNCILSDRVYVTWTDNRNGGGPLNYDIYCNVRGFQNPDTVIGIKNFACIANKFELFKPFPNPFNPVTTVKYSIPELGKGNVNITVKIFDILGNEVSTLVNRGAAAGTYEEKFYAANLSTGIYFVVLESESGFRDSKKLILLK